MTFDFNCSCTLFGTCFPYQITLKKGVYLFEAWGAKGGDTTYRNCNNGKVIGARGGYASGRIRIKNKQLLYIYVGQKGSSYPDGDYFAFNGGGKPVTSGGGGGATDFRLVGGSAGDPNSYETRVLIAAGGGGSDCNGLGGSGGGLEGCNATPGGTGATQDSPGVGLVNGSKWEGANASSDTSAGGGGYFGGGSGSAGSNGGGGGSGYISGHPGCKKYNNFVFKSTVLKSGSEAQPSPPGYEYSTYLGDGYARITFLDSICTAKRNSIHTMNIFFYVLLAYS